MVTMAPTPQILPEAPGAKEARIFGIISIVSALTVVGIPIAVGCGIVALLKAGKARKACLASPGSYLQASSLGTTLGVLGIALAAIMLIPAFIASAMIIPFRQHRQETQNLEETLTRLEAEKAENEKRLEGIRQMELADLRGRITTLQSKLETAKTPKDKDELTRALAGAKAEYAALSNKP